MRTRWRLALGALVLIVMYASSLASGASTVSAHAYLVRTDPADGAVLSASPRQVRLWFSEAITLKLSNFELVDSHGRQIPIGPAHAGSLANASGGGAQSNGDETAVVVMDAPVLPRDSYIMNWRVISADDLHPTAGQFTFGVQIAVKAKASATSALSALPPTGEVALRWINFAGIAGLIGGLMLVLIVAPQSANQRSSGGEQAAPLAVSDSTVPPSLTETLQRRMLFFAAGSGAVALVTGLGLLAVQAQATSAGSSTFLIAGWQALTTAYGARWVFSELALIALISLTYTRARSGESLPRISAAALFPLSTAWAESSAMPGVDQSDSPSKRRISSLSRWVSLLRQTPGVWAGILVALTLALLVMQALQGHVVASVTSSWLDLLVGVLHLLSASVWSGGLVALAVGTFPLIPSGSAGATLAKTMLRRFSLPALVSVVVVSITGLYMAGKLVATPDALLLSWYGNMLLLKVALVLAVGLIGLLHAVSLHAGLASVIAKWLRRPPGWTPLSIKRIGRTLALEATGAVLVLLFAALLAASAPAVGPEFTPATGSSATSQELSLAAEDLYVVASIKPNRPGPVFITLDIYNTRRPVPAQIVSVRAELLAPTGESAGEQNAAVIGADQYQIVGQTISEPGDWSLRVIVHRDRFADAVATFHWNVLPSSPPGVANRPPVISQRPLAPLVNVAAIILLILSLCAVAIFSVRKR